MGYSIEHDDRLANESIEPSVDTSRQSKRCHSPFRPRFSIYFGTVFEKARDGCLRKLIRHTSFGSAGTCLDNAVVESFFSVLKRECLHRQTWTIKREIEEAIRDYIERFYNRTRIRGNGKTPLQSEQYYDQKFARVCA